MRILEVTGAFAALLHNTAETLVGRNIYDITHPDDLPPYRRLLDRLRLVGTPFSITKRYTCEDGAIIWVNNHVSLYGEHVGSNAILATVQQVEAPQAFLDGQDVLHMAQQILKRRQMRLKFFGATIFGEPDFDILLDLYVNGLMRRPVSVSSACVASGVPATTALRNITGLIERGWVNRWGDPKDRRRSTLSLTTDSANRITRYLDECRRR